MNLWTNKAFRFCRLCEVKDFCYKKTEGNCEKTNYRLKKRINDLLLLYRPLLELKRKRF